MIIFDYNYIVNAVYWPIFIRRALLALSVFFGIFNFYRKGTRLGFNRDKLLDLAVFPLALALLLYNLLPSFSGLRLGLSFLSFVLILSYLTKNFNWSYPRILDIACESISMALIFFPIGFIFFNLVFLAQFIFFRNISVHSPKSGLVSYLFFIFLSTAIFISQVLHRHIISFNTILAFVLVSISLARLRNGGYFIEIVRLSVLGNRPLGALVAISKRLRSLNFTLMKKNAVDKKEDYLDAETIKKLKGCLLSKKAELLEPGHGAGLAEEQDKVLEQSEHEKVLAVLAETKKSKEDVENALLKIELNSYGFCEKCLLPIDKARLRVYPEARFCTMCSGKL